MGKLDNVVSTVQIDILRIKVLTTLFFVLYNIVIILLRLGQMAECAKNISSRTSFKISGEVIEQTSNKIIPEGSQAAAYLFHKDLTIILS